MNNDDKKILYVFEIKYTNEWNNLVRFEPRAFHDLSQMGM